MKITSMKTFLKFSDNTIYDISGSAYRPQLHEIINNSIYGKGIVSNIVTDMNMRDVSRPFDYQRKYEIETSTTYHISEIK